MKTSIIYLGIALVTFTNVISALGQQQHNEDCLTQVVQSHEGSKGSQTDKKEKTPIYFEPQIIEVPVYQKTMAEIIAENNQIIESTLIPEETKKEIAYDDLLNFTIDNQPLVNEKTIEEVIEQNNQIIESPTSNKMYPIVLTKPKKSY